MDNVLHTTDYVVASTVLCIILHNVECYIKYPRYAAQTLPQTKLGTFDFLKTNDEKKLHKMSEDFTLYALEFIALLNEQNTIFKVVFGGAAVELLLQ